MHSSETHIFDALNSGADGYVLKEDDHNELINAINSILNGKKYLSPSISTNIVNGYLNPQSDAKHTSSWDLLTRREREIVKLIAEGYRSKDIAEYLSISIKTVEKHRTNLMKKLDLHSVSSLTNYAIQQGIVCT
jgi:DNA-binding NarL/FixJ family response regulator